jgi:hypothetical protein
VLLAGLLRRVAARTGEACRLLAEAERRYHAAVPDHPYAYACTGFHAAVRCQEGNGGPQATPARWVTGIAAAGASLAQSLGEQHPLSLAVASMHANALARAGDLDAALSRAQQTLAGYQSLLGAAHPHALAVEANLLTVQSRLGSQPPPTGLRARFTAAVGPGHPDLHLFTQGQLIDLDFTPLPL